MLKSGDRRQEATGNAISRILVLEKGPIVNMLKMYSAIDYKAMMAIGCVVTGVNGSR